MVDTTDIAQVIGANVVLAGQRGLAARIAAYGDPHELQERRRIGIDAVLQAAGAYEGRRIDAAVLAAIDLQDQVMGLIAAREPASVLGDAVARIAHLARALGAEPADEATRRVARQCAPEGKAA